MADKLMLETGVSGLKYSFGTINEEYLPELRGYKAAKIYNEMSVSDPIVGAALMAIELLIGQIEWTQSPADDSSEAADDAQFLTECWNDMSTSPDNFLNEVMSMATHGWALFETVYKLRQGKNDDPTKNSNYNDGRIGWRKFAMRSQDTLYEWKFDDSGGIQAMIQQDPNTFKTYEIPMSRSLLFRTKVFKNNPEGFSLLRRAYRPWYFKKSIENMEGIGVERDLAGIPMAKIPGEYMDASASSDQKTIYSEIKRMLANIRQDETAYICLPSDTDDNGQPRFDFKLVGTAGQKMLDTDKIIMRKAREILMTVLADFILLGHEKVGSFALSDNKTDLFFSAIETWVQQIANVLNKFAVPRLFNVNGIQRDRYPQFVFGDIRSVDLTVLGQFIQSLTLAGVPLFPDEEAEKYLKRLINLPTSTK